MRTPQAVADCLTTLVHDAFVAGDRLAWDQANESVPYFHGGMVIEARMPGDNRPIIPRGKVRAIVLRRQQQLGERRLAVPHSDLALTGVVSVLRVFREQEYDVTSPEAVAEHAFRPELHLRLTDVNNPAGVAFTRAILLNEVEGLVDLATTYLESPDTESRLDALPLPRTCAVLEQADEQGLVDAMVADSLAPGTWPAIQFVPPALDSWEALAIDRQIENERLRQLAAYTQAVAREGLRIA